MSNRFGLPDYFPFSTPTGAAAIQDAAQTIDMIVNGYNQDIKPITKRTPMPPKDEKPIYIYKYHSGGVGHVGMYYDGERVDLYPSDVYNAQKNDDILAQAGAVLYSTAGASNPVVFRTEANIPEDAEDISCYAIYPSQLPGNVTPDKIKTSMQQVKKECNPYQLYNNNCADQVIKVFKKLGIDMSETKPDGIVALPSSVENFAKANGYDVPFEGIPFKNNHKKDQVYSLYEERDQSRRRAQIYQESIQQYNASRLAAAQQQNPLSAQESTWIQLNPRELAQQFEQGVHNRPKLQLPKTKQSVGKGTIVAKRKSKQND